MAGIEQPSQPASAGSQTLARGIQIVEYLVQADQAQRPADIARATGIQRNAVYRLLRELEGHSFVAREPGHGAYTIGSGLVAVAALVLNKIDVRRIARPMLEELGRLTQETISLHVRSGFKRVCIDAVASPQPISRVVAVGETVPLYAGPSGKAILAYADESDREQLLLQAIAENAVTRHDLEATLARVREHGYLASVGDRTPEVGGLSGPVFNAEGILGSITISGPAERWTQTKMDVHATSLVSACARLSSSLGHLAPPEG